MDKLPYPNIKFKPYSYNEYPKKITVDGKRVLVKSKEEEDTLLPKPVEPAAEPETDDKAELTAKLEAAGVEVDKRWGLKRLQEELDKLNDNAG